MKKLLILFVLWFIVSIFFIVFEDTTYPLSLVTAFCLSWAGMKLERWAFRLLEEEKRAGKQ